MEKVKIFCSLTDIDGIEGEINEWIESENPTITRTHQTQSVSGELNFYITISIFYTKK